MKSKMLFIGLLAATILFSSCSDNGSSENNDKNSIANTSEPIIETSVFDIDEYKTKVSECRNNIDASTVLIANMGNYEFNYFRILGKVDPNGYESACNWLEKETEGETTREMVEAGYETICQQYKDIVLIEREGNEAEIIFEKFEILYSAYFDLYYAVSNPSGTVTSFSKAVSENSKLILTTSEELGLFLE